MPNNKSVTLSHLKKDWLLYSIAATILLISLIGLAVAVLPQTKVEIERNILFVISAFYLLASYIFFLFIYLRNQDKEFVSVLPNAIDELKRVGREYYKNTAAIEDNSERVNKLQNTIEQEIRGLRESNKDIEKNWMELRREKGILQSELEKWNESTINFFQFLERGLQTNENKEVIEKTIKEFEMIVNKRGFHLLRTKMMRANMSLKITNNHQM